ncbi:MAG TPA: hydrogenase maturation protease [Chloroflexi bacterium]|nr:hydrogenase maturation protease [Chloroflexota bacterium]HBY06873.1 hydrogenase maturation protease [Chloroflexota bacterium]
MAERFRSYQTRPLSEKKKLVSETGRDHSKTAKTLIIGVGNEFRGDDAVGLIVARRLAALKLPEVSVIEQSGEGADLIGAWWGAECVYLIDAVSAQGLAGSTYRFEAQDEPLPAETFGVSSHALGVAIAIEMARSLGQLPPKLVVFGIEGGNFDLGNGLSAMVQQAAENVIRRLLQEIGGL